MSWFGWLLGKKESAVVESRPEKQDPLTKAPEQVIAPPASLQTKSPSETDNLRRWKESGRPRAWVEAHQGQWDHAEWLKLLEELKRSPFWPMQADAVGATLEETRRQWLERN